MTDPNRRGGPAPSPPDGTIKFSKPSFRVVQCKFDELESRIRRYDWYRLAAVTQWGDTYTLFFELRPERGHEEDGNGKEEQKSEVRSQ